MRILTSAWLLGLSWIAPGVAFAVEQTHSYPECTGPATEAAVAAAKAAFQAGQASFNEADYTRAIVYWEDALRRDCNATPMLLNLARAYELNEQKAQAIVALETYLQRVSDDPQAGAIRTRIDALAKQLEEARVAEEKAKEPLKPAEVEQPPAEQTPVEAPAPKPNRPIWPLLVAGGGTVVAGVGFALAAVAHGDVETASDKCTQDEGKLSCANPQDVEDGNSARTRRSWGLGVGIGGVVIAGAGVAWYFLQPPSNGATTSGIELSPGGPRLNAGVSPWFSGVELSGSF